jgi:pantoate--beta-alanine ligase
MSLRLISTVAEMRIFSRDARHRGRSLAHVPTMGALHEGHLSLVRQAKRQCDVVIVSIYVNPTQFGSNEDLGRYPRRLEQDLEDLRALNVDAAFAPGDEEMFPSGFDTFVEPGKLAASFEGTCRPGHFRGVCTIVLKLLNIVQPDVVYFGQKDFQQVLVVRKLVEDFNLDVKLVICPIVREPDGLAKSSRNAYLNAQDRQAATVLSRALRRAEELVHRGHSDCAELLREMQKVLSNEDRAETDYLGIVDASSLQPINRVVAGSVVLVAARVGEVRLIDNLIFGPPGSAPEGLIQMALTSQPAVAEKNACIPGLETDMLRLRIERCRDCAAISSMLIPPREFLLKYVKRDYADLNRVRVAVIGRDAPMNPLHFLYNRAHTDSRFEIGLYELVGVRDFQDFKSRFILTDAVRCHCQGVHVPEKALAYCAKHLRDELVLFPSLQAIVVLGPDTYLQFQKLILDRKGGEIEPFDDLLRLEGWAKEETPIPGAAHRPVHVFYCYHPTAGYKRSPSIARLLTPFLD